MKRFFLLVVVMIFIFITCPNKSLFAGAAENALDALNLWDYERAARIAREGLDKAPRDANIRLALAEILMAYGEMNSAENEIQKVLAIKPGWSKQAGMAYYNGGLRAIKQKKCYNAVIYFDKARFLYPSIQKQLVGKYMLCGDGALANKSFPTAFEAYNGEIAVNPGAKKIIAEKVFQAGIQINNPNHVSETLFSYACSLDGSYANKVSQAKTDYGQSLLAQAKASSGEKRKQLKDQALKYVSQEAADKVVPPPAWKTVMTKEYDGKGYSDGDDTLLDTPHLGTDIKVGDKVIITGPEFKYRHNGLKTGSGRIEVINKSADSSTILSLRAPEKQKVTLEIQRLFEN